MQLLWLSDQALVLLPLTRKPGLCIASHVHANIFLLWIIYNIYISTYTCFVLDSSMWLGLTSREQLMLPESAQSTRPGAELCQNACGVVNEQKIFCSHQCSPEYVCKISLCLNWIMWEPCKHCDTWIVRPLMFIMN